MAVAVPFLMSATGASAAIAGAIGGGITAGMVSTITAVAFSVTGISAKIDKAASKVFGADLVNVANIFGAGYAMFNGGFDIGGGGELIGPATDAAGNLTSAPEISSSMWDGIGEANSTAIEAAAAGVEPLNLSEMAGGYDDGAFNPNVIAPTETAGVNMLDGVNTTGPGADMRPPSTSTAPTPANPAPAGQGAAAQATPTATAQTAAGTNAAATNAAGTGAAGAKAASGGATDGNIFTRMFANKDGSVNGRMVGAAMQGVGMVAQGVAQSSEANKARKLQSQLYNARPTGIVRQ